jgi:hypothetical protein
MAILYAFTIDHRFMPLEKEMILGFNHISVIGAADVEPVLSPFLGMGKLPRL